MIIESILFLISDLLIIHYVQGIDTELLIRSQQLKSIWKVLTLNIVIYVKKLIHFQKQMNDQVPLMRETTLPSLFLLSSPLSRPLLSICC